MFENAYDFNQNIGGWDVSSAKNFVSFLSAIVVLLLLE